MVNSRSDQEAAYREIRAEAEGYEPARAALLGKLSEDDRLLSVRRTSYMG